MSILNNLSEVKKLDKSNMLGSIEALCDQMTQMFNDHKNFKLPASYKKIKNVVVAGMGGSALPAHIAKALFINNLKVPVEIVSDYSLPGFVGPDTLVILSSYSGSTEEPVALGKAAKKAKAKIVVIATGKNFAELHKAGAPGIIFNPQFNPCASPRMGLGYQIIGQLLIFRAAGLLQFAEKDFKAALLAVKKAGAAWGINGSSDEIKTLAAALSGKAIFFFAAEHLIASAHIAANQMNENGKRLAVSCPVPELNHHLMEGLKFPDSNKSCLAVVALNSELYDSRIQKRMKITRTIVEQNQVGFWEIKLNSKTRLTQAFEALVATSLLSYYSAILENIDPTPIPYVDYFKEQLAKIK